MVEKTEEKREIIKKGKITCSECGRVIPIGEFYSKSVIDGSITCSMCDKGVLVKGDLLFFPNE